MNNKKTVTNLMKSFILFSVSIILFVLVYLLQYSNKDYMKKLYGLEMNLWMELK